MPLRLGQKVRVFRRNEAGAALVEFSLVMMFFLLLIFGIVEFSMLFFQWNSATKALQQGARLASVSDPVALNLRSLNGVGGSVHPGDAMPYFKVTCTSTSCDGGYSVDAVALRKLIYGREYTTNGANVCGSVPLLSDGSRQLPGMCDIFNRIQPENVIITYEQTGLGFAGRPGGPVPTITIELRNLTFGFIFLQALMRLAPKAIPAMKTTATGEDMNSAAPTP